MPRMSSRRHLPLLARCAAFALVALQPAPPVLAQVAEEEFSADDDGDIAYARTGEGALAVLTSGQNLACDARAAVGSGHWPCRFRTTRYNPANGQFTGEISWTSLGSVHEVRGVINGTRVTFTETRAIRAGGAHLDVSYDLRLTATAASGSWRDPSDDARGSLTITLPARRAATTSGTSSGQATGKSGTGQSASTSSSGRLTINVARTCTALSGDGRRSWPCRLKFTSHNAGTGRITGELTWSSLNSVHVIEGQLRGTRLTFTEVRAIRPGGAHLNVTYDLQVGAGSTTGSWYDPADRSRGTMNIDLKR